MLSLAKRVLRHATYTAYQRVFSEDSRDVTLVLEDLAVFCHIRQTVACQDASGRGDPILTAQLEGRRQVLLRIAEWTNVDPREFLEPQVETYNDDDD